jgi:hypothetical protein
VVPALQPVLLLPRTLRATEAITAAADAELNLPASYMVARPLLAPGQRQIRIRVGRAAAAERWVATGRLPVLVLWSFVEREPASRNHLAEVTLSRQFGAGRGDLLMVVSVIVGFVEETSGSARRRMLRPGGLARDR